jgi:hypothetical protein
MFFLFDLLHLDGDDLIALPFIEGIVEGIDNALVAHALAERHLAGYCDTVA